MAECQLPKLNTRVRFPSPAPSSPRTPYRSRRLFLKSHLSLILSRLLSKSQPLMLGCDLVLGINLTKQHPYCFVLTYNNTPKALKNQSFRGVFLLSRLPCKSQNWVGFVGIGGENSGETNQPSAFMIERRNAEDICPPRFIDYALGGKVIPLTFTLTADTSSPLMDSMAVLTASCTAFPISGIVAP